MLQINHMGTSTHCRTMNRKRASKTKAGSWRSAYLTTIRVDQPCLFISLRDDLSPVIVLRQQYSLQNGRFCGSSKSVSMSFLILMRQRRVVNREIEPWLNAERSRSRHNKCLTGSGSFDDGDCSNRWAVQILYICRLTHNVLLVLGVRRSFCNFLIFNFTIVASLSACTELLRGSRATMISDYWAAASIGRVVSALIGVPIWLAGGLIAIGLVSAAISAVTLASLVWGLQG